MFLTYLNSLYAHALSKYDRSVVKEYNLNFDTNIDKTEEGLASKAFPQFRANKRIPGAIKALKHTLEKELPDIVHIQECRKFTTVLGEEVDSFTPFKTLLESKGYKVLVAPYNPHGERAFKFITAYNPYRYRCEKTQSFYLTKTPDKPTTHPDVTGKSDEEKLHILEAVKEHNFGEEWERSTFLVQLRDKKTNVLISDFNVHLALPLDHKIKASRLMFQLIKQVLMEHPNSKIIAGGDWNTFPNIGGPEQLRILESDGILKDAVQNITLANGLPVNTTFVCYPYDFGEENERLTHEGIVARLETLSPEQYKNGIENTFENECFALGSKDGFKLDHIFYHGFARSTCVLLPTPQFGEPKGGYTEESIKRYILEHIDQGPAFSSDHQPTLTTLSF